jgi:CO/xanthine dehydrogenase Mo-binding subunit
VEKVFQPETEPVAYGSVCVVASVDPGTGGLHVEEAFLAVDVGRAINPVIVEGQLLGSFVNGLGGAILEDFVHSEDGQPLATTFMDYLMPSAEDVPPVEIHVLENYPSTLTALGAKGAGEVAVQGVASALANAIADALGTDAGVLLDLPLTPERVLSAVRRART